VLEPGSVDNNSSNKLWEEIIAYFLFDTGRTENDASNNFSVVACVFVAALMFLPNRCLATHADIETDGRHL
jgi:hypothetical protein